MVALKILDFFLTDNFIFPDHRGEMMTITAQKTAIANHHSQIQAHRFLYRPINLKFFYKLQAYHVELNFNWGCTDEYFTFTLTGHTLSRLETIRQNS